ncbi:gamma-tubulin complex component 5-like isoform X2 [Xenia sp. Carnegie-2017]|uniref:gamma-tubulin complex component 5-like isoform X2 n=1 Tax=Xenia sp. Carnegie-2017 TaxID=2897299 RepID=UPI001F04E64F|nr:gamma-tubulin complex component 5-like isoform X2 [Xenia sp. Carnegie-2017]
MAPIALKDKRVEELTKQLVRQFINDEFAKKNVPLALQFSLSNFRYHKFLDADSNKIQQSIQGLCEKFSIHGQEFKSRSLIKLVEKFLKCSLFDQQYGEKSDVHYSLIKFLLVLSESPVNAVYHPSKVDDSVVVEDDFNWTKYLLEGEEKYMPYRYYDSHEEEFWSDLDSEESLEDENDSEVINGDLEKENILQTNYFSELTTVMTVNQLRDEMQSQIVRETLWMMSKVKELYVYNMKNDKYEVRDNIVMCHLTKVPLKKLLTELADLATCIGELRNFVKTTCHHMNKNIQPLTFQAFAFVLHEYFQKFDAHLFKIEESIIKKEESVTLSVLNDHILPYVKEIGVIFNIYIKGIKTARKTSNHEKVACFLNVFYHNVLVTELESDRRVVNVLLEMFLNILIPYMDFIDRCLTEGKLIDHTDEFCIQKVTDIEKSELWTSVLKIKGDASCPTFLKIVLKEIILAGKSVILLETLNELSKKAEQMLQEESLKKMFRDSVDKLTDTSNLARMFEICLYPHIQVKYEKSCNSLIQLLKTEYVLADHLASLRDFFFLEAGDVMHHFYTEIFKKCRRHGRWQDMSYLNTLFHESITPWYSDQRESFTVGYNRPEKITAESLQGLELNYKAPWPVNLIVDAASQKIYNEVFLFLLLVKQAKWSLDELRFKDLESESTILDAQFELVNESTKGLKMDKTLQHQLHIVRFDLMQFVNILHQYMMTRILHSKLEFEDTFNKAVDLDEIIKAHRDYLNKVLERCLMTRKTEVIKVGVSKILKLAVKFSKLWNTDINETRETTLNVIREDLQKWRIFFLNFLKKKTKRGSYPQLEELAHSLGSSKE